MSPLLIILPVIAQTPPSATLDRAHPIITEVLYAVPPRDQGDADQDGTRQATGDEFIELLNAGDKPIDLAGYQLVDGLPTKGKAAGDDKSHLAFTFPKATLAPGQCAVVFNGFGGTPKGEVGDATAAKGANEHFHGALVFTMRCTTQYQALSNTNDMVVLLAPDGTALQCVRWDNRDDKDNTTSKPQRGKTKQAQPADKAAPQPARVMHDAPKSSGSVTLTALDSAFVPHIDTDATLFSPGKFTLQSPQQPANPQPADKQPTDKVPVDKQPASPAPEKKR